MLIDLDSYDAVLLDLDGTTYEGEVALPGAVELARRLQSRGRPVAWLTNSTNSPQRVQERLARMGIEARQEQIYTAAVAAADYVVKTFPEPRRVFNLATQGLEDLLQGQVVWTEQPPCDVVVAGKPTGSHAGEERRRTALMLLRAGARLVGCCADRVFPSPRGIEFGSGALCTMLAYAANVTPVFTGKPEPHFFQEICRRLGVVPARCVLIGDNLESDIAGAKALGMATVLTLTGIVGRRDLEGLPQAKRPDWVVGSLSEV